jgi:hypothetical protein
MCVERSGETRQLTDFPGARLALSTQARQHLHGVSAAQGASARTQARNDSISTIQTLWPASIDLRSFLRAAAGDLGGDEVLPEKSDCGTVQRERGAHLGEAAGFVIRSWLLRCFLRVHMR